MCSFRYYDHLLMYVVLLVGMKRCEGFSQLLLGVHRSREDRSDNLSVLSSICSLVPQMPGTLYSTAIQSIQSQFKVMFSHLPLPL